MIEGEPDIKVDMSLTSDFANATHAGYLVGWLGSSIDCHPAKPAGARCTVLAEMERFCSRRVQHVEPVAPDIGTTQNSMSVTGTDLDPTIQVTGEEARHSLRLSRGASDLSPLLRAGECCEASLLASST